MNRKYLVSGTKDGDTYYYRDIEAHDKIADLSTTVDNRLDEQDDLITGIKADIENRVATGEFISKIAVEDIVEEALKDIPVVDINVELLKSEILEEVSGKIDNLSIEHSAIKRAIKEATIFFEVKGAPVGTLVDYNCKEIRIMIPHDTDWNAYTLNLNKNLPDNYKYIAFYAYAPENAKCYEELVTYEYPGNIVKQKKAPYSNEDSEEYAGIDSESRKYSIYYFPVAERLGDGTWEYLGKKSSTKDFNGWYYSIEWFDDVDSNGKRIKADTVRVNLSTEENFRYIEPTYEHSIWAKYEELESKYEELENKYNDLLERISSGISEYNPVPQYGGNLESGHIFTYEFNPDLDGYEFIKYRGANETVSIPETFDSKPVVSINTTTSGRLGKIKNLILSKNIKKIKIYNDEIENIYIKQEENAFNDISINYVSRWLSRA